MAIKVRKERRFQKVFCQSSRHRPTKKEAKETDSFMSRNSLLSQSQLPTKVKV